MTFEEDFPSLTKMWSNGKLFHASEIEATCLDKQRVKSILENTIEVKLPDLNDAQLNAVRRDRAFIKKELGL